MSISSDLGVKEAPDEHQLKSLVAFLARNYGFLSIESIEYAFEISLTGALKVDVEHYQSFDKKYVSKVLNAYRQHQSAIIKKASDDAQKMERELKEKHYKQRRETPEFQAEMYQGAVNYVREHGETPEAYDWLSCYKHMNRNGLIKETVEELKSFMEGIKRKAVADLHRAKLEGNYYGERFNKAVLEEPETLKAHWRAQLAKRYFNELV